MNFVLIKRNCVLVPGTKIVELTQLELSIIVPNLSAELCGLHRFVGEKISHQLHSPDIVTVFSV